MTEWLSNCPVVWTGFSDALELNVAHLHARTIPIRLLKGRIIHRLSSSWRLSDGHVDVTVPVGRFRWNRLIQFKWNGYESIAVETLYNSSFESMTISSTQNEGTLSLFGWSFVQFPPLPLPWVTWCTTCWRGNSRPTLPVGVLCNRYEPCHSTNQQSTIGRENREESGLTRRLSW